MPDIRCRKLTVVLAAGALSVFGAAGAFAEESPPGGGGGGGGGGNPLCGNAPTAMLPICADQGGEKPGGGGGSAPSATLPAEDSGPGAGSSPAPVCSGTPLSTTPICAAPGQQPPEGGSGSPSAVPVNQSGDEDEKGGGKDGTGGDADGKGGDPITPGDGNNPLCVGAYGVPPPLCPEPGENPPSEGGATSNAPTIVPAQSGGEEGDEKGGGEDGTGGDSDGKGGDPVTPGDGNNPLCAGTLAGTPLCPSQPGEGPPDGNGGDGGGTGGGGTSPSA